MDGILIITFIGFFVLTVLVLPRLNNDSRTYRDRSRCEGMHQWVYKGSENESYMVCEKCGALPGSDDLYEN